MQQVGDPFPLNPQLASHVSFLCFLPMAVSPEIVEIRFTFTKGEIYLSGVRTPPPSKSACPSKCTSTVALEQHFCKNENSGSWTGGQPTILEDRPCTACLLPSAQAVVCPLRAPVRADSFHRDQMAHIYLVTAWSRVFLFVFCLLGTCY